jgi:serine/threonine protein phosphatase 1
MRTLAIGDIHGHVVALDALLAAVDPREEDLVIFMGDYVDKGPDVKGVIDRLLDFSETHHAVFLRGNHDQMMIDARHNPANQAVWACLGGERPLASYGPGDLQHTKLLVPEAHWDFLENRCRDYFETEEFIFVHGGIRADMEPAQEEKERLLWTTLAHAEPHDSARTVICGHTSQKDGHITDLGHTICIDTAISKGAWLTCLCVETFEFWQANALGECRSGRLRS